MDDTPAPSILKQLLIRGKTLAAYCDQVFVATELRDRQARISKPLKGVRPSLGLRMITSHVRHSKGMRLAAPTAAATKQYPANSNRAAHQAAGCDGRLPSSC